MKRMETKKEKWIARRYLSGMPARLMAAHLQISEKTVHRKISNYKKYGEKSFEKCPWGRPNEKVNGKCKEVIKQRWEKFQCGSVKLHKVLTAEGFGVSQRKIQQILDEYKLTAPCPKRRGQRKYCSYRWPSCTMVLHTDWSRCPKTGKDLIAFIDDHSRFIVGYGLYEGATTKNTLHCLYRILFEHGFPMRS
jgi:transposase